MRLKQVVQDISFLAGLLVNLLAIMAFIQNLGPVGLPIPVFVVKFGTVQFVVLSGVLLFYSILGFSYVAVRTARRKVERQQSPFANIGRVSIDSFGDRHRKTDPERIEDSAISVLLALIFPAVLGWVYLVLTALVHPTLMDSFADKLGAVLGATIIAVVLLKLLRWIGFFTIAGRAFYDILED